MSLLNSTKTLKMYQRFTLVRREAGEAMMACEDSERVRGGSTCAATVDAAWVAAFAAAAAAVCSAATSQRTKKDVAIRGSSRPLSSPFHGCEQVILSATRD